MTLHRGVNSLLEYIVVRYRWIFVCLFLLPASVVYDVYWYVRSWVVFQMSTAPLQHDKRVAGIQKQVWEWNDSGRKTYMCTGRPGWMTMSFRVPKYKDTYTKINCNLVDILELNETTHTVRVEPLVNMGQITALLIPKGWTLPIVPELDDLTVGGLINGAGIETSSHNYGLFQDICVSLEVVLADGSLVKCSKTENQDLFSCIPWSHGTLGFLVAAELKIIPVQPFVRVQYFPCTTLDSLLEKYNQSLTVENHDFVEGIMYSIDIGVVMTGRFVGVSEVETNKINRIGQWYKPWFFKHVEEKLNSSVESVEFIPIRDYYHRHSRSLFWEIQDIVPFGNHPLFRWLLGWTTPPKVSLLKQTQGETIKRLYEQNHVIQDMIVPLKHLKHSLVAFHNEVEIYPLWLCACKLESDNEGLVHLPQPPNSIQDSIYVDIGAYGTPHKLDIFHPRETTRKLEQIVRGIKGYQLLYADSYMTEAEFREMFDHNLYDRVRQDLIPSLDAFPDVYHKVSIKARA